jgi:hypothetical protein
MLPKSMSSAPQAVRAFEVITPDGVVHRFPRPSLLHRLLQRLSAYADVVAVSATILLLIYVAGLAGEVLDRSAFDACHDRVALPVGLS